MRLLYLTNGFPFPLTSGYLRHYFFIRELARRHAITLLSIARGNFRPEHAEALAPWTERVLTFLSPSKGRSFVRRAVHRARSLVNQEGPVRRMCETAARLVEEEPFDAVVLSGKQTSPVIPHLRGLPLIVDICDAASVRIRGSLRHVSPVRVPVLWLDYLRVRRVEDRLVRSADRLLFASCRDREALAGGDPRATVIPNGIDLDYWKRSRPRRGAGTIAFTGGMDYPPNTDAALFLLREVLPRVERSVPGVELLLVGRDPPPRLMAAGRRRGVTVTGFVDDVRPYLERATVFAAPLRFGAGIQNKVLEAMAMEVPVVASPLAADGLRTEDGGRPPVQVAERPEDYAARIVRHLRAPPDELLPDAEARRYVAGHFVWQRNGERLEQVLLSATHNERASQECLLSH